MSFVADSVVGNLYESNRCGQYKVLEYINSGEIKIQFINSGHIKSITSSDFKTGKIKDPYHPSVQGVGYLGTGAYSATYSRRGKKRNSPAYEVWIGKIKNCYGKSKSNHVYKQKGVTVCKEWHNFQVFAEWYYKQVRLYGKGGSVDKDLAFLGNREYSPTTARYVPAAINSLFTGKAGNNITGVGFCDKSKKYKAKIQRGVANKRHLGYFDTYEQARESYVDAKITHVIEVVLKYQDKIPPDIFYKLYTGAANYVNYYNSN
jgi:hypothetical protein